MKLNNNLFHIESRTTGDSAATYRVRLHSDHAIYRAHFPEQPITPGVCLVQMAVELLEDLLQQPLRLTGVKNVKFLQIVSPIDHPALTVQLAAKGLACQATITDGEQTMTKISFSCDRADD